MHCDGVAIRQIDLKKWYNEMPQRSFPNAKLRDAINRARSDIVNLHSREMDFWKHRQLLHIFISCLKKYLVSNLENVMYVFVYR